MKKIKAALVISLLSEIMLFFVGCEDAKETANKWPAKWKRLFRLKPLKTMNLFCQYKAAA
jgi:hypothetical protein